MKVVFDEGQETPATINTMRPFTEYTRASVVWAHNLLFDSSRSLLKVTKLEK